MPEDVQSYFSLAKTRPLENFRYFLIQFQFKFVPQNVETKLNFTFIFITQQTVAARVSYPL